MGNNCVFYNGLVVSFDVWQNDIVIYKCCYKHRPEEYIKRYKVEEWESLDIITELSNNIDNFGIQHDKNIDEYCVSKGAECECFRTGNKLERVCVYLNYECNANCTFCDEFGERRDWIKNHPELRETLHALYFKTLESLKGKNLEVEFTCVGEPLFYKRDMKNFLKSCSKSDFKSLAFVSNGSLFDDELLQIMKDTEIDFIGLISLNCSSEACYNEVMRLSNFDKTVENIIKLKEVARFSVSFVIDIPSLKYSQEYPAIFKKLKENNIQFWVGPNARLKETIECTEEYKFIKNAAESV